MTQKIPPSFSKATHAVITKLSHDGRGIASLNGKTTFIRGALPGEEVLFQYIRHHSRFDEGQIVEVLQPSADRVISPCEYTSQCGGCSLQHLQIEKQRVFKQSTLLQQLKYIGQVEPEHILPPIVGEPLGYRSKARLTAKFDNKTKQVILGFRQIYQADKVVSIDRCVVLHPSIGPYIAELREVINQLTAKSSITYIDIAVSDIRKVNEFSARRKSERATGVYRVIHDCCESDLQQSRRSIDEAYNNEVALIVGHAVALNEGDQQKLISFAQTHHFRIYLQSKGKSSIHLLYPTTSNELLSYQLNAHHQNLNLEFHPADFTQVNYQINQAMVKQAIELLTLSAEDCVLDLFCGLGNFSLAMAPYCQHVVGIENNQQMVARAILNAEKNKIHNVNFYSADLTLALAKQLSWMKQKYNKLLLDPPRTGALDLIKQIDRFKAEKIVYVSCDPATMARDAKILVHQHDYQLKTVGIMDMFPHTSHVESIAMFALPYTLRD